MAKQTQLAAKPRSESGSNAVKRVRARGGVPAVVYGKTTAPFNVEVNKREFENLLAHAAGENLLVELLIEEKTGQRKCLSLVQQVQHHPIRGDVLHVDFHAVSADETIEALIPIEPVGEADGVKNYGGILEVIVRELPVRCLPKDLPEVIHVDVTHLGVGQNLHVRDIKLPEGVSAALDGGITVLSVVESKVSGGASQAS